MTVDELARRMAAQHRPVRRQSPDLHGPGARVVYTVHCAACDGPRRTLWSEGDPPVECEFWRAAVSLGLVDR